MDITLESLGVEGQDVVIYQPFPYNHPGAPVILCRPNANATGNNYVVVVSGVIECSGQFINLLELLRVATPEDDIRIMLCSPGGNFPASMMLVNSTLACAANVTVISTGEACSAASMWLCLAPKGEAQALSHIMFHKTSHGDYGRTDDIVERAQSINAFCSYIFDKICQKNLLTKEEYDKLVEEKQDLYFRGSIFNERLKTPVQNLSTNTNEVM
jgi:ATP-dependent protease ClpP protease subunit